MTDVPVNVPPTVVEVVVPGPAQLIEIQTGLPGPAGPPGAPGPEADEVLVSTTMPDPADGDLWFDPDAIPTPGGGGGSVVIPTEMATGFTIPVVSSTMPQYMKDHAHAVAEGLGLNVAGKHGLVCDGTDDQVQINEAIQVATTLANPPGASFASANSGTLGCKVELSAGQFNVTDSVIFADKVHLAGQGHGTTRIAVANQAAWPNVTTNGTPDDPINAFTHGRPVISIVHVGVPLDVDGNPTKPSWDTWTVSDLEVYGGGCNGQGHGGPAPGGTGGPHPGHVCGIQVFTNSGPGGGSSSGYIAGPDTAGHLRNVAVTECSDIGILVNGPKLSDASSADGAPSTGGRGTDSQALVFTGVKVFHTGWHGIVLQSADSYLSNTDVGSTGNNNTVNKVSFGILVGGGGMFLSNVKSWYAKRAGVTTTPTLSGSGYYMASQKLNLSNLEAQEAYNHGFVFRFCRGSLTGLHANSCGTDGGSPVGNTSNNFNVSRRSGNDCAGFYFLSGSNNIIFDGHAYNQAPATTNGQAWGFRNDGTIPGSVIRMMWYSQGTNTVAVPTPTAWNKQALGGSTLYFFGGEGSGAKIHPVTGVADPNGTFDAKAIQTNMIPSPIKYKQFNSTMYGGTILTEDDVLVANLTGGGGGLVYDVEAYVAYHAHVTNNAKIGIRVTCNGTPATLELRMSALGEVDVGGVATTKVYNRSNASATVPVEAVFAFDGVSASPSAVPNSEQRVANFRGTIYIGNTVSSARLAVIYSEDVATTAGMGVVIGTPSFLKITPLKNINDNTGVVS